MRGSESFMGFDYPCFLGFNLVACSMSCHDPIVPAFSAWLGWACEELNECSLTPSVHLSLTTFHYLHIPSDFTGHLDVLLHYKSPLQLS